MLMDSHGKVNIIILYNCFPLLSVFHIQPPIVGAVAVVLYVDYEFNSFMG